MNSSRHPFPSTLPLTMRRGLTLAVGVALAGALGACGSNRASSPAAEANSAKAAAGSSADDGKRTEVRAVHPRIVIAHDGGLQTIDSDSGKVLAKTSQPGFLRLNPAGDGRHVMVSDGDTFRVFDAGVEAEPHGGHFHYWNSTRD